MKKQIKFPPTGWQVDRLKLDGVMRRLLEMDEQAIRSLVRQDKARLKRLKTQIAREAEKTVPEELIRRSPDGKPQEVSRKEVEDLRARLVRLRERDLLPDLAAGIVVGQLLPKVHIRSITTFTGNRADLEALGLKVRTQAQDVFTIDGTPAQLKALAAQPACRRLRTPRLFFPVVENASAQAEIAAVHTARGLNPNAYNGNGILIGIIDSALEVTHHTFREPTGTHGSRVMYYWVQSPYMRPAFNTFNYATLVATPTTPALPGVSPADWSAAGAANTRPNFATYTDGRLYTRADIDSATTPGPAYGTGANQICCEPFYGWSGGQLRSEHGTHCAGIAAGNGRENNWNTNPTHVGAAPQVTLLYVCLGQLTWGGFDATWEDHLIDAIGFCMEAGRFHQMPVVVSISLATSFGPHNGGSDLDQSIDNLLNSFFDRSVVIAAGNDNDDSGYHSGSVAANSTVNFSVTDNSNSPFYLDIWYSGPQLDYQIHFSGAASGWKTAGQEGTYTVSGQDIVVDRDADPGGGLRGIRMFFEDAGLADTFTIDLRNPNAAQAADFHAYIGVQAQAANISGSSQNARTLSDSACGKAILTVGACAKITPANAASGEPITAYSAAGPTLDGRIKPEIVAVGDNVTSASSDRSSGWVSMSGTSMATPLTAGAVALLFEAYRLAPLNLHLNQDTVKAMLIQHANTLNLNLNPTQAGYQAQQRNLYGNGRLRVINMIDDSQPPPNVDVWVRTADDDYGTEPYIGDCFCGSPDIHVCLAGTRTDVLELNWGTTYDVYVTVRNSGTSNAAQTTVRLKYSLPCASTNDWFEAEDASDNKLSQMVTVNAMNQTEVNFQWRPQANELNAPAGQTHFCLLAEVTHVSDALAYAQAGVAGGDAWSKNIRGDNNIALRNLFIQ